MKKRYLLSLPCLALAVGGIILFYPRAPAPATAPFAVASNAPFLDQPTPVTLLPLSSPPVKTFPGQTFVQFKSFADRIDNLKVVAQKTVLFPDGLVDFVRTEDARSDWDKGRVFFLTERDGSPSGISLRAYLTSSFDTLALKWTYDPARDAILTDFCWHRTDTRSSAKLLDVLLHAPGSATKPFWLQLIDDFMRWRGVHGETDWTDPHVKYYWSHRQLDPADSWRIAFDALLSKPENFPQVWKLRFLDDSRKYFTGPLVLNLLTKPMQDDKGIGHIVVLNDEPEVSSPGNGYVSYYVFDLKGKFEIGGILNSGHRCESTVARMEAGNEELTVRSLFNESTEIDTSFILTAHGLVPSRPPSALGSGVGSGNVIYISKP